MNPMQTHVKVLGVLHIVFSIFGMLIGLGIFVFFGGLAGVAQMDGDPEAVMALPILGGIGALVLIFMLAISIPGLIGGIGLLYLKSWSRILMIVVSILSLINIPLGTLVGIYGLWVLFSADGARLFEEGSVQSPVQYQR
jgi:hypothetical protein